MLSGKWSHFSDPITYGLKAFTNPTNERFLFVKEPFVDCSAGTIVLIVPCVHVYKDKVITHRISTVFTMQMVSLCVFIIVYVSKIVKSNLFAAWSQALQILHFNQSHLLAMPIQFMHSMTAHT